MVKQCIHSGCEWSPEEDTNEPVAVQILDHAKEQHKGDLIPE